MLRKVKSLAHSSEVCGLLASLLQLEFAIVSKLPPNDNTSDWVMLFKTKCGVSTTRRERPHTSRGHLAGRCIVPSRILWPRSCRKPHRARVATQWGSLMGCLMGPSNANGTLVVTPECPGKTFSPRACGGEYSTSAIFHSSVDITIGSGEITVGSVGWCYCMLRSTVSHLA